ncbi:TorF family putative porin [Erythrobacter sp. SN021]|uniref:TorF family putative porin n=1 Tax=Erythrobacter sp. SN021 TaxID=2912574 RepID=UPI001F023364|nr:TorF family putative porin [Erythrobacter sp. SN021]MCF8882491.1 TorF family putative porin [Erythrobacter sp. SN021]|tara:strand:- start:332 stop:1084 length:753 start_codon:yes stop_codon:yes gene_type:complete
MLTSFRGLVAVSLAAAGLSLATPAMAQSDDEVASDFTVSANVALTTDYRFRGVSLSGGDPALQGGFDVAHDSGFYIGTWASSIDGGAAYGDLELDIYAGWSGNLSDAVSVDIGVLYYIYPTEDLGLDTDYIEPYASVGVNFGPAEATFGVAYAPEQDSLGGDDNLYLYTDVGFGLPGTPLTVTGHLGYTDGSLAPPLLAGTTDDTGLDWSLGASVAQGNFEVGVAYIGVEGPAIDGFTDDAIVGTISASF